MYVTDILGDLVRFNTISSRSNLELIAYIENFLTKHGVSSQRITSKDGTKANLFATVGPADRGGIALSGHTDVVPTDDNWVSPPFELTYSNKRLYGRGTCDMKGFIACCLAMVPEMARFPLHTPIHLAFSYDEEIGCLGAGSMIEEMGKSLPRPQIVWVGEPTQMNILIGHKSIAYSRVDIQGQACHSSLPTAGVSAIETAHQIMTYVYGLRGREDMMDSRFTPPETSIHIGLIRGGEAPNILANHCHFTIDVRGVPHVDTLAVLKDIENWSQETCLPAMEKTASGCRIQMSLEAHVLAFESPKDSQAIAFAHKILGANEEHFAPYVTEAGLFQAAGIPSVVCGPGSVDQAHKANEWIDPTELERAMYTLRCIIEHCRNQ